MVAGAEVDCYVRAFEHHRHIGIDCSDATTLDWTIEDRGDHTCVLDVRNAGFQGDQAK